MQGLMTAARLSLARVGARLSGLISDESPSAQRSGLVLFGFVMPCAIALAVAVGNGAGRPLVLVLAIALAVLQIAYLQYGSPGARSWDILAVAAPLTLAVVTLAMSAEGGVLFPLLFASVCWAALSLSARQVVANVLVTIAVSAVPLFARSVGWEHGDPAEGVGVLLVSAAGFALVGFVVYRLAAALRRGRLVSDAVVGALRDGLVIVNGSTRGCASSPGSPRMSSSASPRRSRTGRPSR
jgi:hypothetical protein